VLTTAYSLWEGCTRYKWLMGFRVKKRDGREEMRRKVGAEEGKGRQERCKGMVVSYWIIFYVPAETHIMYFIRRC
jgi:hypothetical protein